MGEGEVYLHLGSMSLLGWPWWRATARAVCLLAAAAVLPITTALT
jgi:hypothetical protein